MPILLPTSAKDIQQTPGHTVISHLRMVLCSLLCFVNCRGAIQLPATIMVPESLKRHESTRHESSVPAGPPTELSELEKNIKKAEQIR